MNHIREYWWIYFGLFASAAYLRYLVKLRGGTEPLPRRIVLALNPKTDPKSSEYDPGLFARQLLLLLIAFVLIGLALLLEWLVSLR